jgi:hypothetical protein
LRLAVAAGGCGWQFELKRFAVASACLGAGGSVWGAAVAAAAAVSASVGLAFHLNIVLENAVLTSLPRG